MFIFLKSKTEALVRLGTVALLQDQR